jgi:hypothetical protein
MVITCNQCHSLVRDAIITRGSNCCTSGIVADDSKGTEVHKYMVSVAHMAFHEIKLRFCSPAGCNAIQIIIQVCIPNDIIRHHHSNVTNILDDEVDGRRAATNNMMPRNDSKPTAGAASTYFAIYNQRSRSKQLEE